jgi:hypothetical protein
VGENDEASNIGINLYLIGLDSRGQVGTNNRGWVSG